MKEPIGVEENILFFYSATEYPAKNRDASTGKKRNEKRGCFWHSFHIRVDFFSQKRISIAASSNCLRTILQWHQDNPCSPTIPSAAAEWQNYNDV